MATRRKPFRINGHVVDSESRSGVAGLHIEAWDKDLIFNDLVGSAVTDAQGAFLIELDRAYFKELFLDRKPDLFFKVFKDGELFRSTEDDVLWNVESGATGIVIEVNIPTTMHPASQPSSNGDQPKEVAVKGQVRMFQTTGQVIDLVGWDGVDALRVEAWDKAHECRDLVACAFTDAAGEFFIGVEEEHLNRLGLNDSPAL